MAFPDEPTREEQRTAELVDALKQTGNLRPLIEALRDGDAGPERASDALYLLGELDLQLLVQIAVDTLIRDFVEDRSLSARRPGSAANRPNTNPS